MTFAARDFSPRRGVSDEHIPQWICEEQATKSGRKRPAALRVAPNLASGFVARRLQPHGRGCALLAPRHRPNWAQRTSSYLCLRPLSSVRLKAQRIHCLNNVKQLALGSFMYASDHSRHAGVEAPAFPGGNWMGTLNEYAKGKGILICPSAPCPTHRPPAATSKVMPTARGCGGLRT